MKRKKVAALLVSGVLMVSAFAGCGMDKSATVATLDGESVSLGVANFAARLQQAQYDDFYVAYFGSDVWNSDLYGSGSTMTDSVKDDVMHNMEEMYILKAHMADYGVALTAEDEAAVADAASKFIGANSKNALKELGAEQAYVEEYLKLVTIQSKMREAIIKEADTTVTDEEVNTSAYSYVRISTETHDDADGNAVAYTEEELADLEQTVNGIAEAARNSSLEEAAEEAGYTVSSGTFYSGTTSLDEEVLEALRALTKEGSIGEPVKTESYYYILRLDAITDEEATESTRESVISEKQNDHFEEVLNGWEESSEWTVDAKVWDKVAFRNLFTTYSETEEENDIEEGTEEEPEAEEETEAAQ